MFHSILVALDLGDEEATHAGVEAAAGLARCCGARLTLCAVVPDSRVWKEAEWSAIGYRQMLDLARVRLAERGDSLAPLPVQVEVATGSVCGGILAAADRVGADLIVVRSHAPALSDFLIGGDGSRVARRAPCSVLILKPQTQEEAGAAGEVANEARA